MNHTLRVSEEIPQRVLESVLSLAAFLVSEARNIERRGNASRESKEMVPVDKVKDAPALARELRWRIRNALGADSGDETRSKHKITPIINGANKRKRVMADQEMASYDFPRFRHFKPRIWDKEHNIPTCHTSFQRKVPKDLPVDRWMEWPDTDLSSKEGDILATVNSTVDTVVRGRQYTENGVLFLERHKAIRVFEVWQLDASDTCLVNEQ
jgi:F-box and leucine-rich repeat protein 10/11